MELEEQPVKKFEQIAFVTLKTKITRMVYLLLEVLPEVQRCRVIIWKVGRAAECDGLENRLG